MRKNSIVPILVVLLALTLGSCSSSGGTSSQLQSLPPTLPISQPPETPKDTPPANRGDVKWGDNIETVKQSEILQLESETEDALLYKGNVLGLEGAYYYLFDENGGLFDFECTFSISNNNLDACFTSFESIKTKMSNLFGTPSSDDVISLEPPFVVNDAKAELLNGTSAYSTEWASDKTNAKLFMSASSGTIGDVLILLTIKQA